MQPGEARIRGPHELGASDLDVLLARSAERLCKAERARAVVAAVDDAEGNARVAACAGELPGVPPPGLANALAVHAGAVDLATAEAPVLREAARQGFSAGAAVGRVAGRAYASLLLAAPEGAPAEVRPRTLAALDAGARRLEAPAAAAAAGARLARLDEETQRLDRLAALGDLLSEIAHEVRNPLVSVKTFLQLMPDRLEDPDFRVHFHGLVTDEVRRIEQLLDAVLTHARPPVAPEGKGAPVGPALEAVAQLLAHRAMEKLVRLELDVPPEEVCAPMGTDALRQVILNLALNAVDATPAQGRVRLAASAAAGLEVRVEDQGPGVPPELRQRVFEPFFTTRATRPGGLGLAISRRLVESAGGTLDVVDAEGGGAAFLLCFSTS
jgi:signal transduction histidine kinase